jgi:hypothetical protein
MPRTNTYLEDLDPAWTALDEPARKRLLRRVMRLPHAVPAYARVSWEEMPPHIKSALAWHLESDNG